MKLTHIIGGMLIALAILCLTNNIAASAPKEAFLPHRTIQVQKGSQNLEVPTLSGEKGWWWTWVFTAAGYWCAHYGPYNARCFRSCSPPACSRYCRSYVRCPHGWADARAYARSYWRGWRPRKSMYVYTRVRWYWWRCWLLRYIYAFAWADPAYVEGEEDGFHETQASFLKNDDDTCHAWADTVFFTAELDTAADKLTLVLKGGPFGTKFIGSDLNSYSSLFVQVWDSVANDTLYWGYASLLDTANFVPGADFIAGGDLDTSDFHRSFSPIDSVTTVAIKGDSILEVIPYYYDDFSRVHIDLKHEACVSPGTPPTFVELSSFTATGCEDYVEVEWTTATELDNAGFNLYHSSSKDAPNAKLNEALIPAQGDELQGATYSFTDTDVTSGVTYYYWLEDVDLHGNSTMHGPVSAIPTSVEDREEAPIPTVYSLAQNYPNPFNATTAISYQLSGVSPHRTILKVYNIAGQEVRNLVDEEQAPGYYSVVWDGRDSLGKDVSSGIYFYRLQAGSYTEIKKMVLLK